MATTTTTTTTFGVFLIGFGVPNVEVKMGILEHNLGVLQKLKENIKNAAVDLYIYCYSAPETRALLDQVAFGDYGVRNVRIVEQPGIVGEFIYKYVSQEYQQYDYTILLLDDICLPATLDMARLLDVYTKEKLDILALPLTPDSPYNYRFMLQVPELVRENYTYRQTNFVELFFYLIAAANMPKYLQFFTKDTKWCWGIDLALHNYGLKMGLMECYPVKHFFKGVSYSTKLPDPLHELNVVTAHWCKIKRKINIKREKY
jgi:hypothetical protein